MHVFPGLMTHDDYPSTFGATGVAVPDLGVMGISLAWAGDGDEDVDDNEELLDEAENARVSDESDDETAIVSTVFLPIHRKDCR
jgi:hypothetical protein